MPALNLSFSDEEMDELRAAAEREGTSLKALAHAAVMDRVSSRKRQVEEAAARTATVSAELLDRLAK